MIENTFTVMIAGVAKNGMEKYVKGLLTELAEHSRNNSGCLVYNIHQSINNPAEFMLYSVWRDQDSFDKHNATPYVAEFRQKLAKELFDMQSPKTFWELISSEKAHG